MIGLGLAITIFLVLCIASPHPHEYFPFCFDLMIACLFFGLFVGKPSQAERLRAMNFAPFLLRFLGIIALLFVLLIWMLFSFIVIP